MRPDTDVPSEATLRRWLLRELSDADAAALEERLLLDDGALDDLVAAEHDLRADYASGALTPTERAAVERYLLTSVDDRRRQRIATALARLAARREARTAAVTGDLGGSDVAANVAPVSTAWRRQHLRRAGLVLALAAVAVLVVVPLRKIDDAPPANTATEIQTVTLLASAMRGDASSPIALSRSATTVRLQLEVDEPTAGARYRLRIGDASEAILFEANDLPSKQSGAYSFVETHVPATALAPGEKRVRLERDGAAASEWNVRTEFKTP